jgi:predicted secreted hydrolase
VNLRRTNWVMHLMLLIPGIILTACDQQQTDHPSGGDKFSVSDLLALKGNDNFTKAVDERKFNFPRDHAAHPDFRQEWWYFTGNVQTSEGRRYGYELTFFRIALHPQKPDAGVTQVVELGAVSSGQNNKTGDKSSWRTNQVYMAHLTLSDIENNKFYDGEQFSRDAMGLAGASVYFNEKITGESTQLKVWLNDWSAKSTGNNVFPITIKASAEDFGIKLTLEQSKPIVLQGNNGLAVKGDNPGNASYYYSITRMATSGEVEIGAEKFTVSGNSWFDREWSTSQLEPEQEGWDWYSLQLDDNRDIMFYSMRRKDGSLDLHSAGALVEGDGQVKYLAANEVNIEVIRQWHSNATNITYPAGWKIYIPSETLELQVTPSIDDQELNNTAVRYWEGSVKISGKYKNNNRIVAGKGYVELAGYRPE